MNSHLSGKAIVLLVLGLLLFPWEKALAKDPDEEIAAALDGEPITVSEVSETVAFQIYRLRGNIYQILKRETEKIVDRKLLEIEASRRGMSVEELLEQEVDRQVSPPEEKEVDAFFAKYPGKADKDSRIRRNRIRIFLANRARSQRKKAFLESLRETSNYRFLLEPPERPRIKMSIAGEPWRGSAEAPVTLVHFTSFTCKLCSESAKMIEKIMEEFPGKIKWVHRNFFTTRDEKALAAAKMGEFAHTQGKFWDFHDMMIAHGGDFETNRVDRIATDLALDPKRFDRGEKEGLFLLKVRDDIGAARKIGVTSIPVVFVNGIYFSGTFPYDDLKALVQKELKRVERLQDAGPGNSISTKAKMPAIKKP
jgi:hypothetical protein